MIVHRACEEWKETMNESENIISDHLNYLLDPSYDASSDTYLADACERMAAGESINAELAYVMSQRALKIQAEFNNAYHEPTELRAIFSRLVCDNVPDSFSFNPPFYTDFGANIHLGERVFINSGCHFQSQGGIWIGEGALIGYNVTIATLNHRLSTSERYICDPGSVRLGKGAWIGANATLTPGVTVGDYAVVAAGAVVTRDVPAMTIVGGVPARTIRVIRNSRLDF